MHHVETEHEVEAAIQEGQAFRGRLHTHETLAAQALCGLRRVLTADVSGNGDTFLLEQARRFANARTNLQHRDRPGFAQASVA